MRKVSPPSPDTNALSQSGNNLTLSETNNYEKDILLSLSTELAAVRNRKDFFEVVIAKVKKVFAFDQFGIAKINEDGTTFSAFILDIGASVTNQPGYNDMTTAEYLVSDRVFATVMDSEDPIIFDINLCAQDADAPSYVGFWKDAGLRYVLATALRVQGTPVGCAFAFLHLNRPDKLDIKSALLKGVCAQLALKVGDILANEEIEKREEEKSILLSFSQEIADIKNRDDFFEVAVAKIKKNFAIERFLIAKINEDRTTFSAFATDPGGNARDQPDYKNVASGNYQINDMVFGSATASEEPVLFDVNRLAEEPGVPAYVDFWKRIGLRYVLIVALRVGGNHIGFAILNFNNKHRIDAKSTLLKGVCAQLALKVSNILAVEEIADREEEKTVLLAFNNEIADIRNRRDFYEVVMSKIKRIFKIERFSIGILNEDKTAMSAFIVDMDGDLKKNPLYREVIKASHAVSDHLFATILASDNPVLFDIDELAIQVEAPEYFRYWKNAGTHFLIGITLRVGGNIIGCALFMLAGKEGVDMKNTLLKGICAQLAVKVSHILANEEIEKREEEKSILLSFNSEIADIRNRQDFFAIVMSKIKRIFKVERFSIGILNEDQTRMSGFIVDPEGELNNQPRYREITQASQPVSDHLFASILASENPVLFDISRLAEEPGAPEYFRFWQNAGIHLVIGITLRVGGNIIGCALFMLAGKEGVDIKNTLLKGICAQLAVKVSQISATEEIAKREEEKTILLSFSNEIADVRNRHDFFEVVNTQLKILFGIKEFGIAQISSDGRTYDAFVLELENSVKGLDDYEKITGDKYFVSDPVFSKIINSEDPVMLDVHSLAEEPGVPVYVDFWKSIGLSYVFGVALRAGGKSVGCAFLHVDKENTITIKDTLLKGVCAQLAGKVSNILDSEEIAKREEEKTILLSFNNEIADIRNRYDFFEVVLAKIKRTFEIERFTIAKINEDGATLSAFMLDTSGNTKSLPDYEDVTSASYSVNNSVFGSATTSEEPVLFDVDQLAQNPAAPAYVGYWKRMGLRYVLIVALRAGGNDVGFALLYFNGKSRVEIKTRLLKGICAQLAVKVSQILADEELTKTEEEKSILLSFSNEIAAIRNRGDFYQVVIARVKKIFAVDRFATAKINEDGTTLTSFVLAPSSLTKSLPGFNSVAYSNYPITGWVFGSALTSEYPIIFDVHQLAEEPGAPAYIHFWKSMGMSYVLVAVLQTGGVPVGFAIFYLNSKNEIDIKSPLLKGICGQLAVKVSQILANEEIERSEEEKSILLSFSNEIAGIRNRKDFFEVVIAKIKKIFEIERFAIAKIDEDKTTYSKFILDTDGDIVNRPEFYEVTDAVYPVSEPLFARIMASEDPILFNIAQLVAEPWAPRYVVMWHDAGVQFLLAIALRVGGKDIGFANLHFSNNDGIDLKINLLKGIGAQLAVIVSHILANEELEKREQEKSMLLAFSNAIAAERNKNALAKILKQQLKALFYIEDYVIHALSDDKKFHHPILFDPDADFAKHPDFTKLLDAETDINDGVYPYILASAEPIVFNAEDWYDSDNPPPYANAAKAIGLKKMTSMRLQLGLENIGFLNFRQDDLNKQAIQGGLFKSICSQIAITLANIIANEKVGKQLTEINKYKEQLEEEKIYLKEEIESSHGYTEMVGESPEIKKVFRLIAQVAYSDSTALLLGETGTGKELIARAIHNSSPRKNRLMVKVNCATLPASLIESELFGHERGSFTGATERRIGKFELANNGTLFLDEIGEMTMDLQVKLLRALQEKEIERVGGKTTIKTDARIIAATNRDLEKLMEEGKFRSDLFYRLNIFPIMVPPLRNRMEDIPKLALHFIERYSKKTGKKIKSISNKALEELLRYDWPGNIRELEHLVERSVLLASGDSITEIHLPHQKRSVTSGTGKEDFVVKTSDQNERDHILKILKYTSGRIGGKGGAAELLDLPTSTLNSRIKKLGIRREHI